MQNNLKFIIVESDSKEYLSCITLAEEILRKTLNLKFSIRELEEEKNNIRIAGFLDGKLCATAMLSHDDDKFFMQRVAVKEDMQNKGIGSELLKFCEEFAMENGVRAIYANARDSFGKSAVNFYTKNEYFSGEEQFLEDGIPHKFVWKIL
ncbi:MAG: GNAT family N-acetyltransferase [Rickettsiales bacterium]|nr:GNAT family N-acetyltransferase [Rickettsiales bacterium]